MLKNLFAAVGLLVVAKAACEHYWEYRTLKREQAKWQAAGREQG